MFHSEISIPIPNGYTRSASKKNNILLFSVNENYY